VDAAIQAAEEYACSRPSTCADLGELAADAYRVATAAEAFGNFAAYAAAHAANAAAKAAQAAGQVDEAMDVAATVWGAYRVVRGAASGVQGTIAHAGIVLDELVEDYQRLAKLALGRFAEVGGTVDPAETGPLGPLWPKGEPVWG
jgi:hypothetical protein